MSALQHFGIENFSLHELVHPSVIRAGHSEARIIQFLDMRVFRAWQWIRTERGNPIYMNTWGLSNRPEWYPIMKGRGLRVPSKSGYVTSQHYFGRAADGDELGTPAPELYDWIMKPDVQEALLGFGVTTIEDISYTDTWIHLDARNWGFQSDKLQIVNPG